MWWPLAHNIWGDNNEIRKQSKKQTERQIKSENDTIKGKEREYFQRDLLATRNESIYLNKNLYINVL